MVTTPRPHTARSAYRSDIDGLRAVAVLLVIFNHLLKTHFRGGYVGVDVFFVISGYLIGATILAELRAGEFSLAKFYERRIRRIFPALFVMLLVASALAYVYFLPVATVAFGESLLAALASGSNLLFWHQSGYFDVASESKPLLHTWSLGVEEQFYIVFPLFLMAVHRWWPRVMRAVLWSVVVVSFAAAAWFASRGGDTTAFFFSPLRAWELLLGAIASQRYLPKMAGQMQRNVASVIGLLLIVVPAVMYTPATHFPGLGALPPVIGAVLLISAGELGRSIVGKALSWQPVVFVGLISYSLYLWHWPIKVFWEQSLALHDLPQRSRVGPIAVFVVSMVVATLSWRFVETPFRNGKWRPGRRQLFVMSGVASVAIAAVGFIMLQTHGLQGRFSSEVVQADAYVINSNDPTWRVGQCFLTASSDLSSGDTLATFDKATCLREDPARKQYLLYGDSHAADKYAGLVSQFPELNISQATVTSCLPLLKEPENSSQLCMEMSAFIFGDYLPHHHVDAVVLSGNWYEADLPELERTLEWIRQHGMQAIVLGPGLAFQEPMPQLIAIWLRDGRRPGFVGSFRIKDEDALDRKMATLARSRWKVRYISVLEDLCVSQPEMVAKAEAESAAGCPLYGADGKPLLIDGHHLSPGGSVLLAQAMRAKGQLP